MERELWRIISAVITRIDRRKPSGSYTHSVGRIVRVYLWAVLHDRPVCWACDRRNWAGVRRPVALPDQSTMSRRVHREDTRAMLDEVMQTLAGRQEPPLLSYLDGKPLPVSRHSTDRQAAFGRGAGGKDRGYKLHAIYARSNQPLAWSVTPLNANEHHVAKTLVTPQTVPGGYLLADANYDANHFYEHAGRRHVQLLTPRRYAAAKGLGHHRHSSYRRDAMARLQAPSPFARELLAQRRTIETRFANLTSFGGGLTHLPPWVRGRRVERWVHGKLIVRLARDRLKRTTAA